MAKKAKHWLVGKKVKAVRKMTEDELVREMWSCHPYEIPLAVEFTDGSLLYPSRDDEGNGPGAIFGVLQGQTLVRL